MRFVDVHSQGENQSYVMAYGVSLQLIKEYNERGSRQNQKRGNGDSKKQREIARSRENWGKMWELWNSR